MKRIACFSLLSVALAFGCGDDDGGSGTPDALNLPNPGFVKPMETVTAYSQDSNDEWILQGDANFDCLNTPTDVVPSTQDVTLSGTLEDFQTGNAVPDGTMAFFVGSDFNNPFATVVSDQDGDYSVTIPTGTAKYGVKVTAAETLDTYQIDYEVGSEATQSENHNSVSVLTANALPAFIGVTRTVGLGVLAGSMRDCDGNEIKGAVATVSGTSGVADHLDGAATYYFSAGASTSLPVRHSQQLSTNFDSLFVTIELPPTAEAYLQVWGFLPSQDPATDELTLLGETPAPVLADTVITGSLEPIRTTN